MCAVALIALQFGARVALDWMDGARWRCQITVAGWEEGRGVDREELGDDAGPGHIYEGDSGCLDGGSELCFVAEVRLLHDELVPCDQHFGTG